MITTDTETAVRGTIQAAMQDWTNNDAAAFAARYAPDATVVLANGTFLQGRDQLRAYMAAGFAGPLRGTRGTDEQLSIRILDGAAIVVSTSGYLRAGQTTPEQARRATWTLARHDGSWLIEAYHNSDL